MLSRPGLALLLGAFCCLLTLPTARGQDPDTTQLPEIAPREIEIRGERQIALPSLERQPLSGFAPSTSVPTIPPDHEPFVASYKQELEDLPESLPVPETVSEPLTPAADPIQGFVEAGGGRYYSRFAEGRLAVPISDHETMSARGSYSGTEGFKPFENSDVETARDDASGLLRFDSRRGVVHTSADVHGSAKEYTLYGANAASGAVLGAPERGRYSAGVSAGLRAHGSVPASLHLGYDRTDVNTEFVADDRASFNEDRLGLRGSIELPPVPLTPQLEGRYTRSELGGDVPGGTTFSLDAGGTLHLVESDSLSVRAGARGLAYGAPSDPETASSPRAEGTFFAPFLHAEWWLRDNVILHVRNAPHLIERSLNGLYETNPYADHAPSLRPTVETTDAEVGVTVASGPVRVRASGGYRYAPTFQYFTSGGDSRYQDGVFRVAYGSARIIHGGAQVALQGFDGIQASVGLSVRDGTLTGGDTVIPNFAPVTADAMFSVSFASGDGLLQATGQFASPRYATTDETNRLDAYVTVGLEGSYAVTPSIEILARAEHLAPQAPTRWNRYPEPPATVAMGLRIRW